MSVSWDDLPEASKQVVINELDAMRRRAGGYPADCHPVIASALARDYSDNVRAVIDAALAKLAGTP